MSRRRTWIDAFDRVPVTFSTGDGVTGTQSSRSRLRLHADHPRDRRRSVLSVVRAVGTRLVAAVSARLRAGVPATR